MVSLYLRTLCITPKGAAAISMPASSTGQEKREREVMWSGIRERRKLKEKK